MAIAIAGVLALPACGSGRTFTAPEFVDQVRRQGVSIQLGQQLPSSGQSTRVYAVTLPPLPGEPPPPAGAEGGPGARGSLYLYGDTAGADNEMQACRASGGLLCYQAANVVIVLETNGIEAQRLAVAIRKLAGD